MRRCGVLAMFTAMTFAAGCNDGGATTDADTGASDTSVTETSVSETSVSETSVSETSVSETSVSDTPDEVADTSVTDTTETADDVTPGPYGFGIRHPRARVEPTCNLSEPGDIFAASDADYICTFAYQGASATLYFQSSPTGCYHGGMSPLPTFTTVGWASKAGVVTELQAEGYDYGGNHHNDSLSFALDGTYFTYGHSSFGYGFRACFPPDCLQRMDDATHVVVADDGCTSARTHPIVCQPIKDDGTFDALEDTFAKCPGDPNN